jgi:hypothetical protein
LGHDGQMAEVPCQETGFQRRGHYHVTFGEDESEKGRPKGTGQTGTLNPLSLTLVLFCRP